MVKKITDFDALTTSASTDLFEVVDVSDTTEAATGTNKKITRDNLFGQDLTTTGSPTFASETITGDLTVDTNTLYVDSTNNEVGIGTTSPDDKLHVKSGYLRIEDSIPRIRLLETDTTDQNVQIQISGGNLRLQTGVSDDFTTATNTMTLENTGNVGIGTASPSYRIDVDSGTEDIVARFKSTDQSSDILLEDNVQYLRIRNREGELQLFTNNDAETVLGTSSGNLGIGTTSPGAKLEVEQSAASTGLLIDQNGNGIGLYIDSASTQDGLQIVQTGVLTGGNFALNVYTNAIQTESLVRFISNNSSASGRLVELQNNGTGNGILIDQNGNGIALNIDTESTTGYGLNIDAASYGAARIAQAGNDIGLYVQKTGTGVGDVLQIVNNGTGDSIDIVHLGSGKAISVDYQDTGANNNVIYASSPTGSSNDFGARWLDSISRFGVLLGNGTTAYRLWVDDNGDLRIHNADPTAHNNGTVVGTQT